MWYFGLNWYDKREASLEFEQERWKFWIVEELFFEISYGH